jgi:hypothetical protein
VFSAIKLHLKSCRTCVHCPSVSLIAEELLRRSHHDLLEMSCVRLDDGNAEDADLGGFRCQNGINVLLTLNLASNKHSPSCLPAKAPRESGRGPGGYSYLNESIGFAFAAFNDCTVTVRSAMPIVTKPAITKTSILSVM